LFRGESPDGLGKKSYKEKVYQEKRKKRQNLAQKRRPRNTGEEGAIFPDNLHWRSIPIRRGRGRNLRGGRRPPVGKGVYS